MTIKEQVSEEQSQLEQAAIYALDIANGQVELAEVSVSKAVGINVSTRFQVVEDVVYNNSNSLSITVYNQQKQGSATTTDLSFEAISQAVKAAIDIAHYTSADPYSGLGDRELMAFDAPKLAIFFPQELDPDQAIALAARSEELALAADKRITNTDGAGYSGHYGIRVYGNSYGMLQSYCSTKYSLHCGVIATDSHGVMEQDYSYTVARDALDLITPEQVGQECARRVLARLSAQRPSTMQVPVLFAAEAATGLFSHLVSALYGSNIYRKSSFLLDKLGQQIFPHWLTIREMPHLAKGLSSAPFDEDGIRTCDSDIVKEGILQHYLLSSYSARKLGMKSTGHAGGIHNWRITGNGGDFTEMLKRLDKGVLITHLMGRGVNVVTGDYSRGASGFWVENGKIQYPLHEMTIAGNLADMFRQIVAIGNDTETRTNIQCGSLLLENMKIAGQ